MAYFAISTGSLVRALKRNGMIMSVFTSSGQTHARPRMIADGAWRLIGISVDQQYAPREPKQRLWQETRDRSGQLTRPFVPHSFAERWTSRLHSRQERLDVFLHMHHR